MFFQIPNTTINTKAANNNNIKECIWHEHETSDYFSLRMFNLVRL